MTTPEIIFVLSAALVLYTYLFYPAILAVLSRICSRPIHRSGTKEYSISIVVCAFNEAANIQRRMRELLDNMDASHLHGELIVVSDGSTDDTVRLARALECQRVHVLALAQNVGKAAALTQAVHAAKNEIIIFADARQTWSPEALKLLLENFQDARVGAASGELMLESSPGTLAGVGLYWRIEKWIRIHESQIFSAVGATGSICAVRRSLFRPIPSGTILDDVYWPLCVAMQGYRVFHDDRPHAFDQLPAKSSDELRRKIRTLSGNFQLLVRLPAVLLPWRNPIWWQFVSHKLCRLLAPWALILMLLCSAAVPGIFYRIVFAAQAAFYCIGMLGLHLGTRLRIPLASAVSSFLLLNTAAWLAFWVWISGRAGRSWTKVSYVTDTNSEAL